MAKQSAGILLFRIKSEPEVFLVHPGGPFFAKKDLGVWSIPKGEFDHTETAIDAAKREFEEETGKAPEGEFIQLKPITQKSGKVVHAWAIEGDIDAENIVSNTFEMIWPPNSGKMKEFPENDKGEWFTIEEAKLKINERQILLLNELNTLI
ncbi:NUDIX domain-containing protein [Dyadobacter frigoris]|uniref:NUDIX domain-containing protein n=1 Tax=Dyadobacter frigoris TaxID=2576211 RepID=A0A4U6D1G0_9BACT|nr:NUDIX domain-containing protein [Dyadobacter frigoris]TKT90426.1 NUDIX domain-containing protein [Dyadobacter frigoris]GLU51452.1 DNA mismatch repair protein MutT [Dyadobacter frigoris]